MSRVDNLDPSTLAMGSPERGEADSLIADKLFFALGPVPFQSRRSEAEEEAGDGEIERSGSGGWDKALSPGGIRN
jgi:hypothetical protein